MVKSAFVLVATPMKSPYCHLTSSVSPCCGSSHAGTISSPGTHLFSVCCRSACLVHRCLAVLVHGESVNDVFAVWSTPERHHWRVRLDCLLDVGRQRVHQHPGQSGHAMYRVLHHAMCCLSMFDRRYDESDGALLAIKQNQFSNFFPVVELQASFLSALS